MKIKDKIFKTLENLSSDEVQERFMQLKSYTHEQYIFRWYFRVKTWYNNLLYNDRFGFSKDNPGMPTAYDDPRVGWDEMIYMQDAPRHVSANYETPMAMNWMEVFFGQYKPMNFLVREAIGNTEEGFVGFSHENFQNIYYFSDKISTFLQIQLNQPEALPLQLTHNMIYDFIIFYTAVFNFRIQLGWLLYINVYQIPWVYLVSGVDWIEECFGGFAPSFLGTNSLGLIIGVISGLVTDAMNHIVYTMPYLPSEGEHWIRPTGERDEYGDAIMQQIVKYRYLPRLWYFNGIPDKIRLKWWEESPFYIEYYYKTYGAYKIQILPDFMLKEFPEWKDMTNLDNEIIESIVRLPYYKDLGKTLKSLHKLFDSPLKSIIISNEEVVPVSIVSESLDLHFSFLNLIDPDLIILQTNSIQENKWGFDPVFVHQYFEHFWNGYIHNFF